jgi:hypothetical protein
MSLWFPTSDSQTLSEEGFGRLLPLNKCQKSGTTSRKDTIDRTCHSVEETAMIKTFGRIKWV